MSDFYELTTPASVQPVLFADASEWARDIDTTDQTLVESLIEAATDLVESQTNRVFESRTFTGKFDCLNSSKFEPFSFIELRRSPLISVTSVSINGTTLVEDTDYIVKEKSSFSRILFIVTTDTLDTDLPYPIEVVFIAGYSTVPEDVITAIKQIVLYWYENRGDVSTDGQLKIPLVSSAIIRKNRIVNTYG